MKNGVDEVVEVKIGFDGIVLANAVDSSVMNMSLKDVYLAFAKEAVSYTHLTLPTNREV